MTTSLNTTYEQSLRAPDTNAKRGKPLFITARVVSVVTGPLIEGTNIPDPDYKNPSDLGKIRYQLLQSSQGSTLTSKSNPLAKPLHSFIKQQPVIGEIVLLVPGPSTKLNQKRNEQEYYYFPAFNLWSTTNHNSFPDLNDYAAYVNRVNQNYEQTTAFNQTTDLSTSASVNFPLGNNFPERSVKPLRLFYGDTTIESRWGSSIRFSSTVADKAGNNWSSTGSLGNPITIIRNGQGKQTVDAGYIPTVENINRDPSSIYLTNGQKIVIDDIQNYFSLASLQVKLEGAFTISVPIQQQLTSIDTISPAEQDKKTSNSNS